MTRAAQHRWGVVAESLRGLFGAAVTETQRGEAQAVRDPDHERALIPPGALERGFLVAMRDALHTRSPLREASPSVADSRVLAVVRTIRDQDPTETPAVTSSMMDDLAVGLRRVLADPRADSPHDREAVEGVRTGELLLIGAMRAVSGRHGPGAFNDDEVELIDALQEAARENADLAPGSDLLEAELGAAIRRVAAGGSSKGADQHLALRADQECAQRLLNRSLGLSPAADDGSGPAALMGHLAVYGRNASNPVVEDEASIRP